MRTRLRIGAWGACSFFTAPMVSANPELHVLLSTDVSAPTAEMVVEPADFAVPGSPPPIQSLGDGSAIAAHYLLPRRADHHFRAYLDANPQLARSKLERYIVLEYAPGSDLAAKLASFAGDWNVEFAHVPLDGAFAVRPGSAGARFDLPAPKASIDRYTALGLPKAWSITGGWGAVGVLDTGADIDHPALADVAAGSLTGGNMLTAYALDIGRTGLAGCPYPWSCAEPNIDEAEPMTLTPGHPCDPDGDLLGPPVIAGHGTHVTGLIGGRPGLAPGSAGSCLQCPIVAWRVNYLKCVSGVPSRVDSQINQRAIDAGITLQSDGGVQVINLSLVRGADDGYCDSSPEASECAALAVAAGRDVLIAAASGNDRKAVGFPAGDPRVIAVGGINSAMELWTLDPDLPPSDFDGCPQPPLVQVLGQQCGSNFTTQPGGAKQELVAFASSVEGLAYPGYDWNTALGCGSSSSGSIADGYGRCTGTSMAAPIVAGIAGLLRSVNPLLRTGDPENSVDLPGIRDVLVDTTAEAQAGLPWNPKLGYGRPDAGAAVRRVLGQVGGLQVRNRATPLFTFYSAAALDHAQTAIPQAGRTFQVNGNTPWTSDGALVAGYTAFPDEPAAPTLDAPRARAYILTTPHRTDPRQPPLVALHGLVRDESVPGAPLHRDFTLVTSVPEAESALAEGYVYRGVQGYVFARCSPEPGCIPAGAQRLLRRNNVMRHDDAILLESELPTFTAQGYTAFHPGATTDVLGYAYPNVDADGDGLVDGFERLIGTDPAAADSDFDGASDGAEYPAAGLPVSDPCSTPSTTCNIDALFFDDFEES